MSDNHEPAFTVVGWGLIPLPGEKKHWRKALAEARRELEIVENIRRRSEESGETEHRDN